MFYLLCLQSLHFIVYYKHHLFLAKNLNYNNQKRLKLEEEKKKKKNAYFSDLDADPEYPRLCNSLPAVKSYH